MDIGPTCHCWVVCVVHRLTWPLLIVGRCGLGAGSTFVWVDASVIGFWMALLVDTGCVKLDPRTIMHHALVFETPSWGHTRRCVRIPVVVFDQPQLGCIRRRWSWSCRGRLPAVRYHEWGKVQREERRQKRTTKYRGSVRYTPGGVSVLLIVVVSSLLLHHLIVVSPLLLVTPLSRPSSSSSCRPLDSPVANVIASGLVIFWVSSVFLPPRTLRRSRLTRPHPIGKGRGGWGCNLACE